jgi:uncharacterized protein (DUF433 family)
MLDRQRQGDSLGRNELRTQKLALSFQVSRFGEDLLQRTHLPGLFEEEANRLFEILERPLPGATAGGYIELPRVRHEGPAFLENLGGELDLHTLLVTCSMQWKNSIPGNICGDLRWFQRLQQSQLPGDRREDCDCRAFLALPAQRQIQLASTRISHRFSAASNHVTPLVPPQLARPLRASFSEIADGFAVPANPKPRHAHEFTAAAGCRTLKEGAQIMATANLDWSQCPAVESVPGKVSGAWLFRDTRMPVSIVFENLETGATIDEIMEWFDVTREQVVAVLEFAARSLDAPPAMQQPGQMVDANTL